MVSYFLEKLMAITDTKEQILEKRGYEPWVQGRQYDLYLSNYPNPAKYLAQRIGNPNKTIAELCCGVGITTRELAKAFKKVVAADIDREVIEFNKINLEREKLADKVSYFVTDISKTSFLKKLKTDVVLYDIPYWVAKKFDDGTLNLDKNPDLVTLIGNIRKYVTHDIIIFAPAHLSYEEIKELLGPVECEQIFVKYKYDRNYYYLGSLMKKDGISKKEFTI